MNILAAIARWSSQGSRERSVTMETSEDVALPKDPTTLKEVTSVTIDTDANGWSMTGIYNEISDLIGVYYLSDNHMWYAQEPVKVNPFRAFLTHANGQQAACRTLALLAEQGGEVEQIGEINADGHINFYDTPIYNMYGQRQSSLQQGQVNIVGNQKIIIR